MSLKKSKTFETEMMDTGRAPNLIGGFFFFLYIFVSSGLYRIASLNDKITFVGIIAAIALFAQFLIAPRTNRIITKEVSDLLEKNSEGQLNKAERTLLVKKLMELPMPVAIQVCVVFLFCIIIPSFILIGKFHISISIFIYIICSCMTGIFNTTLMAYKYAYSLCSSHASRLVKMGVDEEIVHKEKHFGISMKREIILNCLIPFITVTVLHLIYVRMAFMNNWSKTDLYSGHIFILIQNTMTTLLLSAHTQARFMKETKALSDTLEDLTENHVKSLYLPTDLSSELSYNIFLIDELMIQLQEISTDAASTGENIAVLTRNLSVAARETAQTSISESASIKECLVTMEKARQHHKNISDKILQIKDYAENTRAASHSGASILASDIDKINEMAQANLDTIYGIKNLTEKVNNIWKIISTIDTIAERTRTIAFNAELEASEAGGISGEKFHIVANEIRRLASTITNSTREIKQRILNIQHTSDNLIVTSEAGTQKTREGSEFYSTLEEKFKELCISSDVTAESITRITEIIEIQSKTFSQINNTLREINTGFENFSGASQKISLESETLRKTAADMGFGKTDSDEKRCS